MSLKSCNVLNQQQKKTEMINLEKNERTKSRGKIQVSFQMAKFSGILSNL